MAPRPHRMGGAGASTSQPGAAPQRGAYRPLQTAVRLRLGVAKKCDKPAIEALMSLEFLNDATNAILVGPNGIGKSTLAQNIAHQAVIHGHTALFTTAGQLLGDLAALDSDS